MAGVLSDVRWTIRLIRHRPGFTTTVVTTLAVAVAAIATAFGVATAVLWRPLPFATPDRLIFAWENAEQAGGLEPSRVTAFRFADWQRGARSIASMSLFGSTGFLVDRADGTVIVHGVRVSTNYFQTLGIAPVLGRTFSETDGEPGNERVVILSHALWQEWFGGRRDVIGQQFRLARRPYTIVGVMPRVVFPAWPNNAATVSLDPESRQLWVPIARTPELFAGARAHVFGVVARLAPGRSAQDAERELTAAAAADDPDPHGAVVRPFREQFVRDARTPLLALLGAALGVLLVACTNLAALQASAIESRRTELSVRSALGAGRAHLARQFAVEAAVLAGAGGAAGLALAQAALVKIPSLLPPAVPLMTAPSADLTTVLFAIGASLFAAIAFAAWPFARTARAAAPAPRGTVPLARSLAFRALVVLQVALAIGLVASAALLQQSLDTVHKRDAGFVVDGVLVGRVTLAGPAYDRPAQIVAAERRLSEDLARLPGARGAVFAYDNPLEASWIDAFTMSGAADPRREVRDSAQLRIVSPDYFDVMGVAVVEGRGFREQDDLAAAGAVVVNEAFARRISEGGVLNRTIHSATPAANWPGGGSGAPSAFTIVGIVEDERFKGLERPAEPAVYMTTRQFPQRQLAMMVRTSGEAEALAGAARAAIRQFDPQIPVGELSSLAAILAEQMITRRATTQVIDALAFGALGLAGLGLYGLLAMLVAAGVKETGIRLALGSSPRLEARRVAAECIATAAIGIPGGVALALIGGRLLRGLLVGISPRDPLTLAAVCTVMLAVAAAAAALPAWRAARVDPSTVLRR